MDVEVKIKGLVELEARLTELDALAGQRLMQRVLRKVAQPMMRHAQANAMSVARSGALAASIGIITRKTTNRSWSGANRTNVVAAVSVGSIAKNRTAVYVHNAAYHRRRKGIFYGWMLDQGHRIGTRSTGYLLKRGAGSRAMTDKGLARWARKENAGKLKSLNRSSGSGSVSPRLWWTPAVNAEQGPAISAFTAELAKAVARLEKRTGKTANPEGLVS